MLRTLAYTIAVIAALAPSALGLAPIGRAQPQAIPAPVPADPPKELLTVAELSDYKATARYEEVVALMDRMAAASPLVKRFSIGKSVEGREIPAMVIADPPVATPEEARRVGDKLVVLAFGNIHAGEVDGKEALPMLARELILTPKHPMLKDLIVILVPIYNTDGNERVDKANRPGQMGPEEGMGIRENAEGLDLNRDFIKLDAPETVGLVRLLNQWDPAVIIDTHTTNGSNHRYLITHAGPKAPAGDQGIVALTREKLLPGVDAAMKNLGINTFPYGNFAGGKTRWETFPAQARYSTTYFGLRGRIGILSEGYSYAPYKDRVLGTLAFVREIFLWTAANKGEVKRVISEADQRAIEQGLEPGEAPAIAIRSKAAIAGEKVAVLGFVEEERDGKVVATDQHAEFQCELWDRFESALSVNLPYAYLIRPEMSVAIERLQRHGVQVEELREDIELDVEAPIIRGMTQAEREFQKHRTITLDVRTEASSRRVPAGTIVVRTSQKLGRLAAYLLEPMCEDGLATWNFFDGALDEGREFPVARVLSPTPMLTAPARALPEDRAIRRRVDEEAVYGSGRAPNLGGSPIGGLTWIDDETYLQVKEGRLRVVQASTGRSSPFHDVDAMRRGLETIPGIDAGTARRWAERTSFSTDPKRTGAIFEHENDLYYARFDGSGARRLTSTPEPEELASFSPDGARVAFVRSNDLFVVDVASGTERALTTGGSDLLRRGKADWVYFEEVFSRNWRAYWWSPDSSRIAFLETDASDVPSFVVVNDESHEQEVESTRYPRPGESNPRVRLGVVTAAGGTPRWVDTGRYERDGHLITEVGWWPDSSRVYLFVQDRAQTWLDLITSPPGGGEARVLFRDKTEAWITPGDMRFLKDGTFLYVSDRTGYAQLYRYDQRGKLLGQLSPGEYQVGSVRGVDEANGRVYFSSTIDNPIGAGLYWVPLDPSVPSAPPTAVHLEGFPRGDHRADVNPSCSLMVHSWSSLQSPTRVALRTMDARLERTLDTNPVRDLDTHELAETQHVRIPARDGEMIEGLLTMPLDFDPGQRHPVWFTTYAGPAAPVVRDSWSGGRRWEQVLASMGIVVFSADPRSASGKSSKLTWTAYRQLGVQELRDIEDAIAWLVAQPGVDRSRVGIAGHSYGGFMTAFAMTHSTVFSCGIAGAPVTDWGLYDTIYTERYMDTPQRNPDGYAATSVVGAAAKLHGRLLLVHGAIDDNVHLQNSTRLMQSLHRANKQFELMVYPGARHGIGGEHYRTLQLDFIQRELRPTAPTQAAPADAPRGQ